MDLKSNLVLNYRMMEMLLKSKKTHGFNSCIVISVYPLDISSIKKAT